MSLDNIQLSSLVVEEWYKDTLLASPDGAPAIQRPVTPQPAATSIPAIPATPPPTTVPPAPPASPKTIPGPEAPPKTAPPPAPAPKTAPDVEAPYKFLGKNGKKVTILVQTPGHPFLPDNQLTFLTKILEACRMNLADVAIVNTTTSPVTIAALKQALTPSAVLLFGLEPTAIKLPINFPIFKVQPYDDCNYLSAPALNLLVQQSEESKLLKSKLWVCLKTLFNV